jgi:hypothetical protein
MESNVRTQRCIKRGIYGVEYENPKHYKERNLGSLMWEL